MEGAIQIAEATMAAKKLKFQELSMFTMIKQVSLEVYDDEIGVIDGIKNTWITYQLMI